MNGLNFLFWVIGGLIALMAAGIVALVAYGIFKAKRSKPRLNDLMRDAKRKREELLEQNER